MRKQRRVQRQGQQAHHVRQRAQHTRESTHRRRQKPKAPSSPCARSVDRHASQVASQSASSSPPCRHPNRVSPQRQTTSAMATSATQATQATKQQDDVDKQGDGRIHSDCGGGEEAATARTATQNTAATKLQSSEVETRRQRQRGVRQRHQQQQQKAPISRRDRKTRKNTANTLSIISRETTSDAQTTATAQTGNTLQATSSATPQNRQRRERGQNQCKKSGNDANNDGTHDADVNNTNGQLRTRRRHQRQGKSEHLPLSAPKSGAELANKAASAPRRASRWRACLAQQHASQRE